MSFPSALVGNPFLIFLSPLRETLSSVRGRGLLRSKPHSSLNSRHIITEPKITKVRWDYPSLPLILSLYLSISDDSLESFVIFLSFPDRSMIFER